MGIERDLIAAIATPAGTGGIGIIRISGLGARELGEKLGNKNLEHRKAQYCEFRNDRDVIDQGIVLFFEGPNSFTGEDVVELHGHGGPVVMNNLLQAVCSEGARVARPGEFSERAFLNDKMDLAQAEAIADLISSGSVKAAKAAIKTISGKFSKEVHRITRAINHLRVFVEANLDFPDEEIDLLDFKELKASIRNLRLEIESLLDKSHQGLMITNGITVALIGSPNVGKSSLFNALAEQEEAIVTDVPGTTRDVLKTSLTISGLPLLLIDTAGLRESESQVELLGIEKARLIAQEADLVLEVRDLSDGEFDFSDQTENLEGRKLVIYNKSDLLKEKPNKPPKHNIIVSALTGAGIDSLRHAILDKVGFKNDEISFTARARHIESMRLAIDVLLKTENNITNMNNLELIAEGLRQAQEELGEILGVVSADELLGKIFSEFCIGK